MRNAAGMQKKQAPDGIGIAVCVQTLNRDAL
jgi:hypothetical protein